MTEPVIVKTQKQLDKALETGAEVIHIESERGVWLAVSASGSATVRATGSATVRAYGSATVRATGLATVRACGSATVHASDSATVHAYDSPTVHACGSATVRACGSATVRAYDSATVHAYDSATVHATKFVAIHLHSQRVTLNGNGHVIDVTAIDLTNPAQWCEYTGAEVEGDIAYLYKAVNDQWTTERGTIYAPGATPEAPDWDTAPTCGGGLHLCSTPGGALRFNEDATRFVRCGVRLNEMVCLGDKVKVKQIVVP